MRRSLAGISAWNDSGLAQRPALSECRLDQLVGFRVIRDPHLFAVPLELVGRVRAALRFHHKTWGGKRCARSRRVHFCLSLCWAGVQVLARNEDALVRRFDELIRKRMTDAIADVFPEEGFAELVMSFCPVPGEL